MCAQISVFHKFQNNILISWLSQTGELYMLTLIIIHIFICSSYMLWYFQNDLVTAYIVNEDFSTVIEEWDPNMKDTM